MNEAYSPLYGYSPLTQRQIDQYVKMYLPILDLRMVTLITDANDELGLCRYLHAISRRGFTEITRTSVATRMVLSVKGTIYETPCQNA
jgi:hypothetical protein